MNPVLLVLPVLCIIVYFLIKAEFGDFRHQIYILKPIATLLVIAIATVSFWQPVYHSFYSKIKVLYHLLL